MWTIKLEYGCWHAEGPFGQQIWSKDKDVLEKLFAAAGYELKTDVNG